MRVLACIAAILCVGAYVSAAPVDCNDGALKGKMAGFAGKPDTCLMLTNPGIPTLERFSTCWWAQSFVTDETTEGLTYWSYITDDVKTGHLAARDVKHLEMWVNKQRVFGGADFDIRFGLWHHLCFTWCNQEGDYQIFKDGRLMKAGSRFKKGETVLGGGDIVVGQYISQKGAEINAKYALEGNLASLGLWDTVIDSAEIVAMATSRDSSLGCGNLVSWTSFKEDDIVGVETCPTVLTGEFPVGEFSGKVLQMDNVVGPHGYVESWEVVPDMTAMTVCTWGRTTETNIRADLFGYRVKDNSVGSFIVRDPTNLRLYVNAKGAPESGAAVNDGNWHHVCAIWDAEGGIFQYYGDGMLAKSGEGLVPGGVIAGGGSLILGVSQRRLGANFDWRKRFNHELTDFNVWGTVKSQADIAKMMTGPCTDDCGCVISWNAFSSANISPDVLVKDSDVPYKK